MRNYPNAQALIIGMGGLGCPASLALAKAGIGGLTLVDPDRVELSNLHRQPWFRTSDVGAWKAEAAAVRLRRAFPEIRVEPVVARADEMNLDSLLSRHTLAIDGVDEFDAKFAISDAVTRTGVPAVYGGVVQMDGQAMLIMPPGPCLRCLFEGPPPVGSVPRCSGAGVLGSLAGVVGALQASLALSVLEGQPRAGHLLLFCGRTLTQRTLTMRRRDDCDCGTVRASREVRWMA